MKDLISRSALIEKIESTYWYHISESGNLAKGANSELHTPLFKADDIFTALENAPAVDALPVDIVAQMLCDAIGDPCACNVNCNDEWLPYLCELQDACPHPCGVACWEQYLKYRHCKNEMEAKEDGK